MIGSNAGNLGSNAACSTISEKCTLSCKTPNVVLLDLSMPDDGLISADAIKAGIASKTRCVLAISAWNDEGAKV